VEKKTAIAAISLALLFLIGSFAIVGETDARKDKEYDDDEYKTEKGVARNSWLNARVRAIHLSPDAPNVDIWVDGVLTVTNLAFGESTPYLSLPYNKGMSTYRIQVVPSGATTPVVIDANLRLRPLMDYTIVASGKLSEIAPIVIEDFRYNRPIFRSFVRFAHTSPDAPAVDIAVQDGRPVLFSDVSFGEVASYIRVKSGTYDLEVRVAGTNTVVLSVDDVDLSRGKSYTVFATGLVSPGTGEPGLGAMLVLDR